MRNGGRRPGSGRPKQRTVLEVALSLSAPAEWAASVPDCRRQNGAGDTPASIRYRPSKASVIRSSIPAAAVRRQEIDVNAGRGRRSLSDIEAELVERTHAATANDTTTSGFRHPHVDDGFDSGYLHSVFTPQLKGRNESGSSMNDFLFDEFPDGSKQPAELRGLKWIR